MIVEDQEQEDELNAHHQQAMQLGGDATTERTVEDSIEVSQPRSKHVHFGSDAAGNTATATNITPHPRKMTVKRRLTLSPGVSTTKRTHTSIGRTSLPPSLSQNDSTDPTAIIQELQFAPLRAVLDERVRRRLRRSHLSEEQNEIEDHVKRDSRTQQELEELREEAVEKERRINDLALDLETQRQFAIDVSDDTDAEKVQDLERELTTLRNELSAHLTTHGLDGDVAMPDDDMLVLNSQEHIAYPELPETESSLPTFRAITNGEKQTSGETKASIRELSQSTTLRSSLGLSQLTASWEDERRKFEDAIMALHGEANDARARLQILEIELQGLGFGGKDVQSKVILSSIRESFESIRESLETSLPDTIPEGASTQDIIEILIANLKEFADRLRSQDQELHEKGTLIADLGNQIQGLLDHLTEAEIRKTTLSEQWRNLDIDNEAKAREIEDLEEELQAAQNERDSLREQLDDKIEEARALSTDHGASVKSLEKLTISLEDYRTEETRLTTLITRMEEDHRVVIANMNKEREETVQDLEERLETEVQLRDSAEKLAVDRQTIITRLEITVEEITTERDTLREDLETAKTDRDAVQQERDTAEADLEEKEVVIGDLETRVDKLEEELTLLNAQLDELRRLSESERHQREAAENDLDDRNVEIDQLNTKLHDQGKEANELRLKLFEVQQQNAQKVKDLEEQASERDEQYQTDIAAEVTRRQAGDELAQERADTIVELESRIEEIEIQMRDDLADRDERIAALEDKLAERKEEIEGLRMDLRSAESTLDVERTQYEDRVEELNISILALQETITQHEVTIQRMETDTLNTADLHNSEIEDRNAEVADLHAETTKLRTTVSDLQHDKAGLERRVEQEAEQMLELQNDKEDEIDTLKATITDKQTKILVVEEKAIEADKRWQEVLDARDEEIVTLKTTTTTQEDSIATITTQYQAAELKFREHVERTALVIANLRAAIRTAKNVADDEGEMIVAEGNAVLEEIEAMDIVGQLQVTRTSSSKTVTQAKSSAHASHSSSSAKKGRGRKAKRVIDSGIGLGGEVEEEMVE